MSPRLRRGLFLAGSLLLLARPLAGQAAADSAWNAGDLERASELYEERLATDSTDLRALHRLALVRAWDQDFEASLELFAKLLELDPDHRTALRDRARVLGWSGRNDRALDELDRVLARERDDALALEARAHFRRQSGDLSGALEDYGRLSALRAGDPDVDLQRARLLSWQSRLDESVDLYDSLTRARPEDREIRLELARVLSWAGRLDSTLVVYRGVLEEEPEEIDAIEGVARVLGWRGDLRASERSWRRALEVSDESADAHLGLARTLRWQGRPAAARSAWRRARALAPENDAVRAEERWLDAVLGPFARPRYVYEGDSDGNRIHTASLNGGFHLVPRFTLGYDVYGRRASNESGATPGDVERETAGGLLEAGLQLEPGWWLRAGGGVSYTDGGRDDEIAAWRASLASPGHMPFAFVLSYRREPLDLTRQLVENGVRREAIDLRTVWTMGRDWRLVASGSPARYSGTETNDRWTALLSLDHDLSGSWRLGVTGRGFGFERDLNEGYFDPDLYLLAELNVRWQAHPGDWQLALEVDPGVQQIGEDGDASATVRTSGSIGYRFAPGRQLDVSGAFSSTGLQSFSTADADYRYGRVSAALRWGF